MRVFSIFFIITFFISGCGQITGLPAHGGGKRFAIEQELVAATARATAKEMDVSAIQGKTAAVYIVGLEDGGSGNLVGGRYSLNALLRGESLATPSNQFPVISTTTTSGGTTTEAENALNVARRQKGRGYQAEAGIITNGLGAYDGQSVLNPRDAQFLSGVVQEAMALKGVQLVDPLDAEFDVYVTVDVFGTVRSRIDLLVHNEESLTAKTALEIAIINRETQKIVAPPQMIAYEAEYNEEYRFWVGPTKKTKSLRKSRPLLVNFAEMDKPAKETEIVWELKMPKKEQVEE